MQFWIFQLFLIYIFSVCVCVIKIFNLFNNVYSEETI